jgi:nucleotide-binding universal stress UspA family protein
MDPGAKRTANERRRGCRHHYSNYRKRRRRAKKKGITIKSEVVYAEGKSVVKSITEYANRNHIDIIVIGGGDVSERTYLIVGGGVAMDVIKKSQCPVIVMR